MIIDKTTIYENIRKAKLAAALHNSGEIVKDFVESDAADNIELKMEEETA
jgi:hypothetical protein